MTEKYALVRKAPNAVEKAAPAAKRILSDMVADALALRRKRVFEVAICGYYDGLDEYLISYIQGKLTGKSDVQCNCFTYKEELLTAAADKSFDLFFVFLNPDLPSRIGKTNVLEFLADLKKKFHTPIFIISNFNIAHTYHQYVSSLIEAGADAFFSMPFDIEDLELALTACGAFAKTA